MSARSSKAPKATDSGDADIYVGLLFVSVAALIAGITFLSLELNKYDWTLAS
jgi:hypothetical protein